VTSTRKLCEGELRGRKKHIKLPDVCPLEMCLLYCEKGKVGFHYYFIASNTFLGAIALQSTAEMPQESSWWSQPYKNDVYKSSSMWFSLCKAIYQLCTRVNCCLYFYL
jgi:hypothetical protein